MKPETLTAEYPCCGRPMRLSAQPGVERVRWLRTCRRCSTTWDVRRTSRLELLPGLEASVLEFIDTKSTEYRLKYGV